MLPVPSSCSPARQGLSPASWLVDWPRCPPYNRRNFLEVMRVPMQLTPKEVERILLFSAAELARKRFAKGLKLNHPEAIALIADEMVEGAREGKSVAQLMSEGSQILKKQDVMDGVAEMIPMIQVEGLFPDGTKLITIHDPIRE